MTKGVIASKHTCAGRYPLVGNLLSGVRLFSAHPSPLSKRLLQGVIVRMDIPLIGLNVANNARFEAFLKAAGSAAVRMKRALLSATASTPKVN